jgi:hypothetical protein
MKKSFIYLGISAFVFIFSQVYEHFSHGVYSGFMIYAFLIPFVGLFVPSILLKRDIPDMAKLSLKCGIATLTVGSIYKGVLEIYGTSTNFEIIYLTVGLVLCILAGILMAIKTNIKAEG